MVEDKVRLIPLEKEHVETVKKWRNDEEIRKYFFNYHFINQVQQEEWFERYCKDNKQIIFAIIESESNNFIGTIGLSNIDHFNQRAELGTLIGNNNYWGKGFATKASLIVLNYAFNNMNLNKIYCQILDSNTGSIKKNEKVGFKIEGRLKDHAFNDGAFHDVILMGILREDFSKEHNVITKEKYDES